MAIRNVPRRARMLIMAVLVLLPFVAACGPAAVAGNPGDFSINTYAGQRMRWNPCTAVHWRADLRNAPAGALPTV